MGWQSTDWGFESPVLPFDFWMLTESVLIFFIKPEVPKTLNILLFVIRLSQLLRCCIFP